MKNFFLYIWRQQWSLSLFAGLFLGLSYPPLAFPVFQILAFVLLLRIADRSSSYREAAYWSYFSFVLWNLIVTYWLMMATVGGGIAAILANSVLMTIPIVLQRYVLRNFSAAPLQALLITSCWVGYEYLHHFWDLSWPWLALGNGWANYPSLVQYISFTGYLGISFWVVLVGALLYLFFRNSRQISLLWSALAIAVIPPIISLGMFAGMHPDANDSPNVDVVIAQPDFNSYEQYFGYSNPIRPLRELLQMSDSLRTDQSDLIIWPENAVQPYIGNRSMRNSYSNRIKELMHSHSSSWDLPMITGATYFEYFDPDTQRIPSLVRNPESQHPYIYFNSAVGFYPDSAYKVYKKVHLVPLVERIPFLNFFNRIDPFGIPWSDLPWYGQGKEFTQFSVAGTRTPAFVCYDSVFPHWIRGFVQRGAGFFTIITNDGWWGNTSGHIQHFAYARLRAIEFRRWIARSANNGISGVIDPAGQVVKRTDYGTRTGFTHKIPVKTEKTFFARYGGWLPLSSLVFLGVCFLIRGIRAWGKDLRSRVQGRRSEV